MYCQVDVDTDETNRMAFRLLLQSLAITTFRTSSSAGASLRLKL
jgi:hypothetical protein